MQTDSSHAVTLALRRAGTATRADLARMTGLSATRIGQIVADLVRSDLVRSADAPARGGVGRPGQQLRVAANAGFAVGINVTPVDVRAVAADAAHSVLCHESADLRDADTPDQALGIIGSLVERTMELARRSGPCIGLGVAMRGPVERATGTPLSPHISPLWAGVPVAQRLQDRFGLPVHVDNHGRHAVRAERLWGAGRTHDDVIWIGIDEGVGGGILSGGRLVRGGHGLAGELGHVSIDPDGQLCRCGGQGCLETRAGAGYLRESLRPVVGDRTRTELLALIEQEHPSAMTAVELMGQALGRGLAQFVDTLDPSAVCIGGTFSRRCGPRLLEAVRAELRRRARPEVAARVDVGYSAVRYAEPMGAAATVIIDRNLVLTRERDGSVRWSDARRRRR